MAGGGGILESRRTSAATRERRWYNAKRRRRSSRAAAQARQTQTEPKSYYHARGPAGPNERGVLVVPRTLPLINAQSFGPLTSDICRGVARACFELSFSGRAAGIRAAAWATHCTVTSSFSMESELLEEVRASSIARHQGDTAGGKQRPWETQRTRTGRSRAAILLPTVLTHQPTDTTTQTQQRVILEHPYRSREALGDLHLAARTAHTHTHTHI